jgi:hypothetical protein
MPAPLVTELGDVEPAQRAAVRRAVLITHLAIGLTGVLLLIRIAFAWAHERIPEDLVG